MSILTWIDDNERLKLLNASKYIRPSTDSNKGLWTRCDKCGVILYIKHLIENQRVCFGCAYHLQMNSPERIKNLLDKESWRPFDETVSPCDPLSFHDQKNYTDRLQAAQDKTGLQDAIQTGSGRIEGIPVALGVMDFDFMGGSMGSVVGEKITRLIEYATQEGLTLILICASGGARMQEGVFGLMQMAKISSALRIYQSCANLLYISILTSPTTGGVTASFGMLGDIIFAEPRALIAFAGRRVIEQTLCEDLPEDFQSSEYMLNHGLVDLIVPRRFLRQALSESIKFYKNAPFKKTGKIPFGVQNPINFVTEEKVRRQWLTKTKWSEQLNGLPKPNFGTENESLSELRRAKTEFLQGNVKTPLGDNVNLSKWDAKTSFLQPEDIALADTKSRVKSESLPILSEDRSEMRSRSQPKYRDILTSFQMIFHLFNKQLVLPDPSSETDLATYASDFVQQKPLLQGTVQNSVLHLFESPLEVTPKQSFGKERSSVVSQRNYDNNALIASNRETNFAASSDFQNDSVDFGSTSSHSSSDPEKEIDLLNQAIELAATESIEWRAFYVSQRLSKTTAEDFLLEHGTPYNQSAVYNNNNNKKNTFFHNTLFYKSICRNTLR